MAKKSKSKNQSGSGSGTSDRDESDRKGSARAGAVAAAEKAAVTVSELLRLAPGPVELGSYDTRATPGFDGDKVAGRDALNPLGERLADLQERLYANARAGDPRRVLLVLQGMDTSGKGGTVRHVVGSADPAGLSITSFRTPTAEEREHDFLWRIRQALPDAGQIGVFDRSHYEDVLVVRVKELAERRVWARRYTTINRFEARLAESGCTVVKVMLHISPEEQKERLLARLDDPTKHWKYNPGDVDERGRWPAYQEAYEAALERCNTDVAPWHVVPADRKWYRNWAITTILVEHLERLALDWPAADFDVEAERARVLAS